MQEIIGFALFGLGAAAVYTLLAQGAVLIYRGSGVVNFAQGGFALVGGYVYFEALKVLPKWPAALVGVAAAAALGLLVQLAIMWPMRRSSALARVVATLGILSVLTQAVSIRYESTTYYVPSLVPQGGVSFAGVSLSQDRIWLFGIALVLTTALWLGYRYTRIGLATSAVAENQTLAASLGWSPRMIAGLNWTLGAALAGAAGVLLPPISGGLTPNVFVLPMVAALSTALVGAFRSFPLTMLGGVLIAVLQSECTHYISTPGWTNAVPFLVIIVLIVLRGRALPLRSFRSDRLPAVGSGKINPVGVVFGLGLAIVGIYGFSDVFANSITVSAAFGLVAMSLVVVTGYAGQISLAQYALAGVGALASARMMAVWDVPFLAALVLSMAVTVLVGLVVSLPALRARGVNLAVVTLGLALVIETVVLGNPDYTGGVVNGTVVDDPNLFGWHIQSVEYPRRYALVCVIVLALVAVFVARLRRRGAGRRLLAVRDNERAAASVGVNVVGAKLYAFGVGAALAALGGSLIALKDSFVDFTQFGTLQSINVLMLTVIGAVGFVLGAFVSGIAAVGGVFQQFLSNYFELSSWWLLILGLLLIVQLVLLPDGVGSVLGHQGRMVLRLFGRFYHREPKARAAVEVPRVLGRVAAKPLEMKDVTVQFGSTVVLNKVNLTVNPGEVVGLIGPNGAGKTTLIDVATGLVKARAGQVLLGGEPVDRLGTRRRVQRGLARSWQSDELFEVMTVAENLRVAAEPGGFGCYVRDILWRERPLPPAVAASVQQFELEELLERLPTGLSYAARRLVGVARAMATEPSVLLLDEPAAGLDENSTEELISHIRRMAEDRGLGILLIEHDVSMVMRTCDRVVAINFGEEIITGTPAEVRAHPAVISAYLGRAEGQRADQARAAAVVGVGADSPAGPPAPAPEANRKTTLGIGEDR
jgi:ABC-type branched-subunit amino acid transport system ATPase component/branched-subunit amino acid ABC-type transport system permease component